MGGVFRVWDAVFVKTAGKSGRISHTNGHAFKVAGKWV